MTCVCADATHSTPQPAKRFHMHAAITALGFLPSQILESPPDFVERKSRPQPRSPLSALRSGLCLC